MTRYVLTRCSCGRMLGINGNDCLTDLLSKADQSGGPHDCWPWIGYRNRQGYGRVARGLVPRLVLAHTLGRPVEGDTRHSCDNPPCCNPAHLSEGSRADNVADMYARGRGLAGRPKSAGHRLALATAGAKKLTPENVAAIREQLHAGETQAVIAARYGVSPSMVSMIRSGRTWRTDIHVPASRVGPDRGAFPQRSDGRAQREVLGHLSTAVRSPKERSSPAAVAEPVSP